MIARSGSNPDLLRLPEYASSRMITEFTVEGVGGGLIVVNSYGDYVISVGPLLSGTLSTDWKDKDVALDALCEAVDSSSEKCTATDLNIGGCGVLLYFVNSTAAANGREELLNALVIQLMSLSNTNVLCIPGKGVTSGDIKILHEAKRVLDAERPRSQSISQAAKKFDFPVPESLCSGTQPIIECAAYSVYGALATLTKA
eukprot:CAMPEP_0116542822 /NCGR_PEP_ID=MMETSP0397-20121206/1222_1 /TAXON_ID=216820 /ORGANISM="Cyclophora tenuis, Strain ECT3854" /LENGTH=199 /DNA_ID=CAMNT_0004066859 /DNA_START=48 /DNA_END=644 /DNA_ORIENTATION=-